MVTGGIRTNLASPLQKLSNIMNQSSKYCSFILHVITPFRNILPVNFNPFQPSLFNFSLYFNCTYCICCAIIIASLNKYIITMHIYPQCLFHNIQVVIFINLNLRPSLGRLINRIANRCRYNPLL